MRWLTLVTLLLALEGCDSTPGPSRQAGALEQAEDDEPGDDQPSEPVGAQSTPGVVVGIGEGGAPSVPFRAVELICESVDLALPPPVALRAVPGETPAPEGGSIIPGVYNLSDWVSYGDTPPPQASRSAIFVVDEEGEAGFAINSSSGKNIRAAGKFTFAGAAKEYLQFTYECPEDVKGEEEGTTFSWNGDELWLFDQNTVQIFQKQ